MVWNVRFHDEFDMEFAVFSRAVRVELLAHVKMLEQQGPISKADSRVDAHLKRLKEA